MLLSAVWSDSLDDKMKAQKDNTICHNWENPKPLKEMHIYESI